MQKFIATTVGVALAFTAMPALAGWWSSSDITVKNTNTATVGNEVITSASTGDNTSNGGKATNDVSGKGSNGDNSATGGNGGAIGSGVAIATSLVSNDVNSNTTKIKTSCGCKGDITVKNRNTATVENAVATVADTGSNTTNGGKAKNDVEGSSSSSHWWSHSA